MIRCLPCFSQSQERTPRGRLFTLVNLQCCIGSQFTELRTMSHVSQRADPDCECVVSTARLLRFKPVQAALLQRLCRMLSVPYQITRSRVYTASGALGPPCQNLQVEADGNCFFRAVSVALFGTEQYHGTLRNATIEQLHRGASTYMSLLRTSYQLVSEYISESKMNTLGIWATEVEIQALADFTGLNIYTFMGKNWLKYTCNGYRDSDQGIYLQNRGNHYETVVCVKRQEKQSCYRYCDQDIDDSMVEMASDEDGVDDLTLVVQPDKRDETWILAKLGWSLLHTSWPAFLEWLGDRWWGSVSYEKIMSFMARPNIHAGDVVVAAHFGDTRGGVCSITVKTEDAVQTFTVAISGGRYVCTDLVDRDVLDPIDIVREMQSATRRVHLLPRPRGMPEIPNCLSVTEVMKQMRFLMSMMDTVWWGASRSNSSSHQHREMMRQLKDETAPGDRDVYGVLGHNLDEQSLGYLFEVVTLKGRFKVSFDKSSFLVDGTGDQHARFPCVLSIMGQLSKFENICFLGKPILPYSTLNGKA